MSFGYVLFLSLILTLYAGLGYLIGVTAPDSPDRSVDFYASRFDGTLEFYGPKRPPLDSILIRCYHPSCEVPYVSVKGTRSYVQR